MFRCAFPRLGKSRRKFSKAWKKRRFRFQSLILRQEWGMWIPQSILRGKASKALQGEPGRVAGEDQAVGWANFLVLGGTGLL
jgi:hypothetical protein